MKTVEIKAIERKELGKKATKAIRKQEHVPCVMYGQSEGNVHFHAHKNEFRKIVYTPNSYIIDLSIDDKKHKAIMQSIDFHPVTDEILHIDFFRIDENKEFKIDMPIKTVGQAVGVKDEGGVLSVARRKVLVKGLMKDLPDELEVDISDLSIGDAIRINDLEERFEGLEFLDPQSVVASVNVTRLAKALDDLEAESEEGLITEEGAEGEGAEATGGDSTEEKTDE